MKLRQISGFAYPEYKSKVLNRQLDNPHNTPVLNKDTFKLSFQGAVQDKFLDNFVDLLDKPENRDQQKMKSFIESNFKRPFIATPDSKDVINKLLEADFTNNNTDFSAETRKVLDKVFENEICLTHGNYAEKLMAKLHEITKLLSKDVHQKTALKKDNFGRIYEDIAAKEVGRQIIPQIAEKIAREENISKEKILPQLKQVLISSLSAIVVSP